VGLTGGHRLGTHYLRRLRHVGGVLQQELLRGRGHAPQPDLAVLFAMPHRELRARQPPATVITWWTISPALLILIFPLGFRFTCYYYRRAYYRSFWWAPPACAVADAHVRYTASPGSRSSSRTSTATSSTSASSST